MNKSLYYFGIFILGLSIAAGLVQSILHLQLGGALFMLESFMPWFFATTVILLIGSCLLLKYFHHKKYWFAFSTLILAMATDLSQRIFFYLILSGAKEFQAYFTQVIFLVLGVSILYSLSLVFFSAGKKRWLKLSGFLTFFISCILLAIVNWSVMSDNVSVKITLEKTTNWIALVGNFLPVLLILNFREEIRVMKKEKINIVLPEYVESILGLTGMVTLALALVFGLTVSGESSKKLYWQTKNAQETEKFVKLCEERNFTNSKGETLKYLLLKPKEYDPQKKYPLVVSLPYGGYEASAAQLLSSDAYRYRYPAFLFVPYRPEGTTWGGLPNLSPLDSLVFEAINAVVEEEVSIDVNRLYVTGVSMGAYGSWHFIQTRPEMFAAAIPVCGAGNPQLALNLKNVSVWAFHGAHDRNVPVSGSRDMIEAIKKAGGNPRYTEFPDKAHDIWYDVTQTAGVWDWLFEQKRGSLQSMN